MRGKYWEYRPMRGEYYLCMKDTVLKRKLERSTQYTMAAPRMASTENTVAR